MKRYYLKFQGYTIHPEDPGYSTITEARKELRKAAKEECLAAKRARWKSAAIIAKGKDHCAIHASRHEESPLWTRICVVSA